MIAGVPQWTGSREWTKFASQQSVPISLMVGRKYYIEALAKEGGGGDHVAVRWQLPGGVWENPTNPGAPIPGIRLSQWGPVPDTSAPTVPEELSAEIVNGTRVDLSWAAAIRPRKRRASLPDLPRRSGVRQVHNHELLGHRRDVRREAPV